MPLDMDEKMPSNHKAMLQRMTGCQEINPLVLQEYFRLKRLVDKVDGFISVSDLARLILDCEPKEHQFVLSDSYAKSTDSFTGGAPDNFTSNVPDGNLAIPVVEIPPAKPNPMFVLGQRVEVLTEDDVFNGVVAGSVYKDDVGYVYQVETSDGLIEAEEDKLNEA